MIKIFKSFLSFTLKGLGNLIRRMLFFYRNKEDLKIQIPNHAMNYFYQFQFLLLLFFISLENEIDYRHQILATIILLIIFVNFIEFKNLFLKISYLLWKNILFNLLMAFSNYLFL